MLQVESINVFYGAGQALRDVSLSVNAGELVTLLGANGAGKSTTLRAISGLVRTRSGEIRFQGQPIHRSAPAAIVRAGIAHAPEGRRVFPQMTVWENLELGAYLYGDRVRIDSDREEVYTLFPRLQERHRQLAGSLSGGEQQMLALGRALMARPRLLLLDEPSLGLAPLIVTQVMQVIQAINRRGTAILLVEQNAAMALAISHRGYVLETGRVTLSGPASSLLDNDHVRQAYLGGGRELPAPAPSPGR